MSEPKVSPQTAFPVNFSFVDDQGVTQQHVGTGMSLRDYFAGQALNGLCAQPSTREYAQHLWAEAAYLIADAMLKERTK